METITSCNAYCERLRGTSCVAPPYSSAEMCTSIECPNFEIVPPVCLPSAKAYYDCGQTRADICLGAADGCPSELQGYEDCISTPQCPVLQPTGGCTDPKEGACYQTPLAYECDHVMGRWQCPAGTQPAPVYDCSGSVDPNGSGGSAGDDRPATMASCNAYCDRLGTTTCDMPPYSSAEVCKSIECPSLGIIPEICVPSAKAYYDCARTRADICPGAADGCPAQLKTYEDCQVGIGTLTCTSPEPQGGCSNATEGKCYHDPIGYQCDTLRGVWRCPDGTVPAPAQRDCSGSGGTNGGSGGARAARGLVSAGPAELT